MARKDLTIKSMAPIIGISEKALNNKMLGKTEFSRKEMLKIRNEFFPDLTIGYLFELDEAVLTA